MSSETIQADDFWRAIEFAGKGSSVDDVADVVRYVKSRGSLFENQFFAYMQNSLTELRSSGVQAVVEAQVMRPNVGDSDRSVEIDAYLQGLILKGPAFFRELRADPRGLVIGQQLVCVDLLDEIRVASLAVDPNSGPLWREEKGDRRRNGDLWLVIDVALGVGVGSWNSWPWSNENVVARFEKAGLMAALSNEWRGWRKRQKIRSLDISIEYWHEKREGFEIQTSRSGMQIDVVREADRIRLASDSVDEAQREAHAVLEMLGDAVGLGDS